MIVLAVVGGALWRWRGGGDDERPGASRELPLAGAGPEPRPRWQWNWPTLGIGLGVVLVLGWVLAAIGGVDFGPSTVGASAGAVAGDPNWWLIAFLLGIVLGGAIAARGTGAFELRGETNIRYARLVVGGFLLGAGGWIAGGCNLGHARAMIRREKRSPTAVR